MGQAPETTSFSVAQPKLKIHLFQFLMYITFHFSVVKSTLLLLMAVRKSRAVSAGLLANAISSGQCRDSPNFSDGVIISQLVVYAACFLALLSTAICWLRISKKKPRIRATLSWYNYCAALLLTMMLGTFIHGLKYLD